MRQYEFMKKVALTLEISLKMVDDWISRIHPDNKEEKEALESYKAQVHDLLLELKDVTDEVRASYSLPKVESELAEIVQEVKELEG